MAPPSVPSGPAGDALHHLRADGVSLVLDLSGGTLPRVVHWGADLGPLSPADLADLNAAIQQVLGVEDPTAKTG